MAGRWILTTATPELTLGTGATFTQTSASTTLATNLLSISSGYGTIDNHGFMALSGGTLTDGLADFINDGTISVLNGESFATIAASQIVTNDALIQVGAHTTLSFGTGLYTNAAGGTLAVLAGGELNLALPSANLSQHGVINVASGGTVVDSSALSLGNLGTLTGVARWRSRPATLSILVAARSTWAWAMGSAPSSWPAISRTGRSITAARAACCSMAVPLPAM